MRVTTRSRPRTGIRRATDAEEAQAVSPAHVAGVDRGTLIRRAEKNAERWSGHVDRLLEAFSKGHSNAALAAQLEGLRHKRDTVLTKVEALRRHEHRGWRDARREFLCARRELRAAWRTVMAAIERENMFA